MPYFTWTSTLGWTYCPFLHPMLLERRYYQLGFYARRAASGTTREVGVVRLKLDFKNSLVPQPEV